MTYASAEAISLTITRLKIPRLSGENVGREIANGPYSLFYDCKRPTFRAGLEPPSRLHKDGENEKPDVSSTTRKYREVDDLSRPRFTRAVSLMRFGFKRNSHQHSDPRIDNSAYHTFAWPRRTNSVTVRNTRSTPVTIPSTTTSPSSILTYPHRIRLLRRVYSRSRRPARPARRCSSSVLRRRELRRGRYRQIASTGPSMPASPTMPAELV